MCFRWIFILLLCFCFFLGFVTTSRPQRQRAPRVKTDLGWIEGYRMKTRNRNTAFGFSGIPFAKPPVGDLRFKDPIPPDPWQGVKNTKVFGNMCAQILLFIPLLMNFNSGNEDCLYMSVYSPDLQGNYPVLVYFHGGAYFFGSGELNHNPSYFLDEEIVVVTANYRLGALGFLSLEDEILSGNMGLKDQNMVLKWVNKNIDKFGGDPNKVTMIGESAGGASVHYHLKSPLSQGLFSGAITCSGSSHSPWAYVQPGLARSRAIKVAEILGCPSNNSKIIIDCLQTKKTYDISFLRDPLSLFAPVIDSFSSNAFLPDDPWFLPTAPVPFLAGAAKYDGILKSSDFIFWPNAYKKFDKHFNTLAPISMFYERAADSPKLVSQKLRNFYFGDEKIDKKQFEPLTNMYTDAWFFHPTMSGLHNHTGIKYLYYMDYLGEHSYGDTIASVRAVNSTAHVDLTLYLWNMDYLFTPLRGKDLRFSKAIVKAFSNFIKNRDPAPPGSNFKWDQWSPEEENYLHITNNGFVQEKGLETERYMFWQNLGHRDRLVRLWNKRRTAGEK